MKEFSKYFDHTLLAPDVRVEDIIKLCEEAAEYGFYSVCVNSCYVNLARSVLDKLDAKDIKVAAVVGFPLGAMSTAGKVFETLCACEDGAEEIDMVMNIGALKDGRFDEVMFDIDRVADKCHSNSAKLKVIIETCLLTEKQIFEASKCALEAGADFVKTSTGFSTGGAEIEDIRLIRRSVGNMAQIKASGGIRNLEKAMAMIEAGADRIGASCTVDIMKEYKNSENEKVTPF